MTFCLFRHQPTHIYSSRNKSNIGICSNMKLTECDEGNAGMSGIHSIIGNNLSYAPYCTKLI